MFCCRDLSLKIVRHPTSRTLTGSLFFRPYKRGGLNVWQKSPVVHRKKKDQKRQGRHFFMDAPPPTETKMWAYWAYTFKIPLTGLDLPHVDIKPSTQQRSDCRRAHLSWSLAAAMTSPALVSDLLELIAINLSAERSNNWRRAGVPLCKTS